jgi:hypothetical protein
VAVRVHTQVLPEQLREVHYPLVHLSGIVRTLTSSSMSLSLSPSLSLSSYKCHCRHLLSMLRFHHGFCRHDMRS